ncbi:hypothetical protein CRENBAI_006318 [Crenichthys baileyi]|uniref:Uncharacterized protein n=1 Tax=Crenichthys baileyi TaxID=28760 RepID=A0AAV9R916_9TELE
MEMAALELGSIPNEAQEEDSAGAQNCMNSNPVTRRSPTNPDTSPGSRVGPRLHVRGNITCLVIVVLMKASSASLLRPMPEYYRGEKNPAGFRPGHGTLDQLYTLYRVLEVSREFAQPQFCGPGEY